MSHSFQTVVSFCRTERVRWKLRLWLCPAPRFALYEGFLAMETAVLSERRVRLKAFQQNLRIRKLHRSGQERRFQGYLGHCTSGACGTGITSFDNEAAYARYPAQRKPEPLNPKKG
jgi:hypothetical protein